MAIGRPNGKAELPLGLQRLLSVKDRSLNRADFEFGARLGGQLQRGLARSLPEYADLLLYQRIEVVNQGFDILWDNLYEPGKTQVELVNGDEEESPLSPLYCKRAIRIVIARTQVNVGFWVTSYEYPIESRPKEAGTGMRCAIRIDKGNNGYFGLSDFINDFVLVSVAYTH